MENKSARKNVMDIGPFHRYVDNQMLIEFRRGSVVSCTCQLKRIYSPILNIITKKETKNQKNGVTLKAQKITKTKMLNPFLIFYSEKKSLGSVRVGTYYKRLC